MKPRVVHDRAALDDMLATGNHFGFGYNFAKIATANVAVLESCFHA